MIDPDSLLVMVAGAIAEQERARGDPDAPRPMSLVLLAEFGPRDADTTPGTVMVPEDELDALERASDR